MVFEGLVTTLTVTGSEKRLVHRRMLAKCLRYIDLLSSEDSGASSQYARLSARIFDPLGGFAKVRTFLNEPFQYDHDAMARSVNYLMIICEVLHFHALHLAQKECGKPSWERANYAARELFKLRGIRPRTKNAVMPEWKIRKQALPFLYAAKFVDVGPNTLFDNIVAGSTSFAKHQKYLNEWFQRTQFLNQNVFGKLTKGSFKTYDLKLAGLETSVPSETMKYADAFQRSLRRSPH